MGVRARWNRWAIIDSEKTNVDLPFGEPEIFVSPGLKTEVTWQAKYKDLKPILIRDETLSATKPVTIRRWRMVFPSTADHVEKQQVEGRQVYRFTGREGTLEFSAVMQNIALTETLHTNDINTAVGKGTRGPIPLMLSLEATNIVVKPDAPLHLNVTLRLLSGQ